MDEYIKRSDALDRFDKIKKSGVSLKDALYLDGVMAIIENLPSADVAPVVHGTPVLRYRPERYERYDDYGLNENGEMLYLKRVLVDEKSYAMYCPACGKRLCSRFRSFCPNCGAKMDGAN